MENPPKQTVLARWVVMGVYGCGKSEIGSSLAAALHVPFLEGDACHSDANVAKMAASTPLDDTIPQLQLLHRLLFHLPRPQRR
jgi:carbohydrate kinase (thermoresistant glucokinase family)